MKVFCALVVLVVMAGAGAGAGAAQGRPLDRRFSPALEQFSYSFATLPLLPRRFQNHCGYYFGHFVCADHCGLDDQVYFCSKISSGCCHVGRGYCDDAGHLRCMPALF